MKLKELEAQRDREVTGFFWLGLQIAFIFGIPAFTAAIVGKKLSEKFGGDQWVTICLVISFIFSWLIIIYVYKKKSKKIKEIEDKIKELKSNN